jgi:sec-independent protein translocase protein TatA
MPIPLIGLGWPEALIILLVVLVLFGGSRLAGLGKGVGRSIREFKSEVKQDQPEVEPGDQPQTHQPQGTAQPTRPDQPAATPVDDDPRGQQL